MARRTQVAAAPELNSWEDVNRALKEIAECEIAIETLQADMNMKINDAKADAEKLGKPLQTAIEVKVKQIEAYVNDTQDELEGKSKYLNFGVVGFRKSSRISYSTKKTKDIIEKLKKYNMINCINVEKKINKESMKLYSDKELARVGAKRIIEEKFYCEADSEKLR